MSDEKQTLKTLYRALKERPLDPQVDAGIYEPYVAALPDGDPIARLFSGIEFAESQSLQLVTGQRGTGKSTELKRLRNKLLDTGYIVFYVDMLEYLHPSEPVEITDFLVSACLGLAQEAKESYQLDHLQQSYWERLREFSSKIKLQKASAGFDAAGLKFGVDLAENLKIDNTFKRQLQEASRGHIKQLVADAHNFVRQVVDSLRTANNDPDQQVVLIIDSFEQIRGHYKNAREVHDSIAGLFNTHGEHLQLPMLHTVITIPPYLSSAAPGVARILGSMPVTSLPSIHVRCLDSDKCDDSGVEIMQNIIHRRSPGAHKVFNDAGLRELAIASGGDLRDFFLLVRSCLVNANTELVVRFPIQLPVIQRAKEQLQRSMLPIHDDAVRWLAKIQATQQAELPSLEQLPALATLFDTNLVINYRNGDDWYGIHPLIANYVAERAKVLHEREADE